MGVRESVGGGGKGKWEVRVRESVGGGGKGKCGRWG